jgi:excisionase family DNA binding protein
VAEQELWLRSSNTMVAARPADDGWLSSKDAAHRLGLGVRTLFRLIDTGELPAYRLGWVIRLREEESERISRRLPD